MATTAPTPVFFGGNVNLYTKENAQADDTNLFSLGNIFSILDYGVGAAVGAFLFKISATNNRGIRMFRRTTESIRIIR